MSHTGITRCLVQQEWCPYGRGAFEHRHAPKEDTMYRFMQKLRKKLGVDSSPIPPKGAWPHGHFDLGLLASRMMREGIYFYYFSHQFIALSRCSPRK